MLNQVGKFPSFAANFLLSRPFYASLDVTNYCNLRCSGCDFPLLLEQQQLNVDLPLDGIEARLENMRGAFGNLIVVLAGFEPTVRKDLASIIAAAAEHNYVGIVTNGTLVNREKAISYWEAGLMFASVSMPTLDDERFREITQVQRYGVEHIKTAVETLVETAPMLGRVAINVTIDNETTPAELESITAYAKSLGALVSFQPYSASKPASVDTDYNAAADRRTLRPGSLEANFGGSLSETVLDLKRRMGNVVGRASALKKFDIFVNTGKIPFKPRSLKVYTTGEIGLYPEREAFSNIDANSPKQVWLDYRHHVEALRQQGPFLANNCYRCVNLTNPSTPIGDIFGTAWRAITKAV